MEERGRGDGLRGRGGGGDGVWLELEQQQRGDDVLRGDALDAQVVDGDLDGEELVDHGGQGGGQMQAHVGPRGLHLRDQLHGEKVGLEGICRGERSLFCVFEAFTGPTENHSRQRRRRR